MKDISEKSGSSNQLLRLVKYTSTALLVVISTFLVDVTIRILISRTWVEISIRNVIVIINKIAVAYFKTSGNRFN